MVLGNRVLDASCRLLATALAILFCCFAAPALAAPNAQAGDQPMAFAVVRGAGPLCQPDCPEWIWAEGTITADTAARFKKFLKGLGKRELPLVIQSPGGDIASAFAMGRMIRARGMDVAVGYTTFNSCLPRDPKCKAEKQGGYTGTAAAGFAYCNSACPLVLAGGVRRVVGPWAHLGVHQVTSVVTKQRILYRTTTRVVKGKKVVKKEIVSRKNTGSYTTTKMSKALRRDLEGYLKEMGVSIGLIAPMEATPASEILRLPQDQLLALNLITSLDQVDLFAGAHACRSSPSPDNCVEAEKPVPTPTFRDVALAAPADGMRFQIVRAVGSDCHPDCPEWISASGWIGPGSADDFRNVLSWVGNRPLPVVIDSRGGDLRNALALGRLIHARGLDVAVGRTAVETCLPEAAECPRDLNTAAGTTVNQGGNCLATCALVLAAGKRRLIQPGVRLSPNGMGLHPEVQAYLREMGLNEWFFRHVGPRINPTLGQLVSFGLVTDNAAVDALTAPGICKLSPRPANCRVAPATAQARS